MSNSPNSRSLLSTKHLPYPLAWSWNEVLRTPEDSQERQAALLACLLATLRTLVALLLADYVRGPRKNENEKVLENIFNKNISNGDWVSLWVLMVKHIKERGEQDPARLAFLREAYEWYHGQDGNVKKSLNILLQMRNKSSHTSHPPSPLKLGADVPTLFKAMENLFTSLQWLEKYSIMRVCRDLKTTKDGSTKGRIQLFRGEKYTTIPENYEWRGILATDELYLLSHERNEALLLAPWAQLGWMETGEDIFIIEKIFKWRKIIYQSVLINKDLENPLSPFDFKIKDQKVDFGPWWEKGDHSLRLQTIQILEGPALYGERSDVATQHWVPVRAKPSGEGWQPPASPERAAPGPKGEAPNKGARRWALGSRALGLVGALTLGGCGFALSLSLWMGDSQDLQGGGVIGEALGFGSRWPQGELGTGVTAPDGGARTASITKPKKVGKLLTNSLGMAFQGVSEGSFRWASKSGRSARVEITRPFLIQTTEVTVDQWVAVMGADPSMERACGGACPVELVSWYDALLFANKLSEKEELAPCYKLSRCKPSSYATLGCSRAYEGKDQGGWCGKGAKGRDNSEYNYECEQVLWVSPDCEGYRLPTEAEWEFAARAGETGPQYGALDKIAWGGSPNAEEGCPKGAKHPVAKKVPNALGLYDVLGNVAEWVWDVYEEHPEADQEDPSGPGGSGTRVFRGGSECQSFEEDLRLDARRPSNPINRSRAVGFRLARSLGR